MTEYRLQFRGTSFPVRGGEVTLGRSSYTFEIVINNPLASREHAVLRLVPGGTLEIVDLGSKNGTFVNEDRVVGARPVQLGDRIKIGTDVIEVSRMSGRDPSAHRVATLPGRTSASNPEGDTTVNMDQSLEVAESLIQTCTSEVARPNTAEAVVQVMNQFWVETGGGGLSASEVERVRRIVRTIASWKLGASIEQWQKDTEARFR